MFNNIDFGVNVKIIKSNDTINENIPIENQINLMEEDLLQVVFENDYLIDIGWYPEFDEEGSFIICIIKDYQWDEPIMQRKCREFGLLKKYLHEFINIVQTV